MRCDNCRRTPLGLLLYIYGSLWRPLLNLWLMCTPDGWTWQVESPFCLRPIAGFLYSQVGWQRNAGWPSDCERRSCAANNHFSDDDYDDTDDFDDFPYSLEY